MTDRAHWMRSRFGMMVHYLPPEVWDENGVKCADPEQAVADFDLNGFLADFDASGAEWLVFTIGQNTGFYNSPNAVIERVAGPGFTAKRDLVRELAEAVYKRGRRFIAYLPCEVFFNHAVRDALLWDPGKGHDQAAFQRLYCEVIQHWSVRLGNLLGGWMFDGCYRWEEFDHRYMHWAEWFAAARAGNPERVVSFNDGCYCVGNLNVVHWDMDFFFGEGEVLDAEGHVRLGRERPYGTFRNRERNMPGGLAMAHLLLFIDAFWWHRMEPPAWWLQCMPERPECRMLHEMEPPLYSDARLGTVLEDFCGNHGAVTFNLGIYAGGRLNPASVAQLARLAAMRLSKQTENNN